jgi:hypothetical protein
MGWQKRSRKYVPPGTTCYLCGDMIAADQDWNRDHVPPQRFYGKSIRSTFNPNLDWLPTHTICNSGYKKDEEYYAAAFSSHADSDTGRAVFEDWGKGVAKGHDAGLWKMITGQFGKLMTAEGSLVFNYDVDRMRRMTWKLVKGVYFAETGRFLRENQPKRLIMLSPHENKDAADKHPWWRSCAIPHRWTCMARCSTTSG